MIYKYDRFDRYWSQGFLINNIRTIAWSRVDRQEINYEEKCRAFRRFTIADQGRSRIFIKSFNTPEECKEAINNHNEIVNFVSRVAKALNLVEKYKKGK